MSDSGPVHGEADADEPREGADVDIDALREEIDDLQARIDEKTLHRDEVERDLKRYVRKRVRRGHATGWGPYLVLLYGTVMTLGAFYFLSGWVSFFSMLVIWLSVLGLYVVMLAVGVTINVVGLPGIIVDKVRDFRN